MYASGSLQNLRVVRVHLGVGTHGRFDVKY